MLSSTLRWLNPRTNSSPVQNFSTSLVRFDDGRRLTGATHRVNNFEKRLLVWMGKFKSVEEVPVYVAPEMVEKVRTRMRIRTSNYMMVATLVGCAIMVYSGKKARDRGESLQKQNLEWHKEYQDEHAAKTKAAAQQ